MSYVTYLNQKGPPNKRGPKHWINHYNTHQTFFNSNKSSCPPPTAKKAASVLSGFFSSIKEKNHTIS